MRADIHSLSPETNPMIVKPLANRRDVVRAGGRVIEVDHLIVRRRAWGGRPEAKDGAWVPIPFGPLVIAYRVTG